MDRTITLIFAKSLNPQVLQQKSKHFYNLGGNEFSPNLEGVAQKMSLPCPQEALEVFGRKSKFKAAKAFIFDTKRVPNEVNKW